MIRNVQHGLYTSNKRILLAVFLFFQFLTRPAAFRSYPPAFIDRSILSIHDVYSQFCLLFSIHFRVLPLSLRLF